MHPAAELLTQPGGLADRLKRMRRGAGLTGEQLESLTGMATTKISKIENGRQMPTEADITAWASACGQPDAPAELLAMLAGVQAAHFQNRVRRRGHAAIQQDLDELVRQAKRIRNVEVALVPGLLQTPDYARHFATEISRVYGTDPGSIEAAVSARMRRQEVLYDAGKQFEFVITESVLRMRPGGRQVMLGQIDRLLTMGSLGNITLGVIPLEGSLTLLPLHGFLMLDDQVVIETYSHDQQVLPPEEAAAYGPITDALLAESLTGGEAERFIADAAARLRAEGQR